MKSLLLQLCFFLTCLWANAQERAYFFNNVSTSSNYSRIDTNSQGQIILVSGYKQANVQNNSNLETEKMYLGTPFFRNNWFKGKMVVLGSEPMEGNMSYDLVKNVVYYSPNPTVNAVELRPTDFTIDMVNFTKYKDEYEGAGNYYYETLVETNPRLLKQYTCIYVQTKTGVDDGYGSSKQSLYEGEYKKEEKYYLALDGKLVLVSNKKAFAKSLGTHAEKAEEVIKNNKLNLKKEADIIEFAQKMSASSQ